MDSKSSNPFSVSTQDSGSHGVVRIDPDVFLETPSGRLWTPERSKRAWNLSFDALKDALESSARRQVLVVCGLQGAGKSTWIERHARSYAPCVCFDAALPGARHRAPIVAISVTYEAIVRAVWIKTPLDLALRRNASRPANERVPEESIRSVAGLFEPPSASEGFLDVTVVENV